MNFIGFSRRAASLLFWPALALVVWGELTGPQQVEIHLWDKLLHFIAYFGLAGLAWVALDGGQRGRWAIVSLIAVGGVLEIIQGMTGRDMSVWDELANSIGAIAGMLAGIGFLHISRLVARAPAD